MSSPVMRDDAIAALAKEQHLPVPVVRAQRPPVAEHDRLPFSPILVINLSPVFCRYRCHDLSSKFGAEICEPHYPPIAHPSAPLFPNAPANNAYQESPGVLTSMQPVPPGLSPTRQNGTSLTAKKFCSPRGTGRAVHMRLQDLKRRRRAT